MPSPSTPEEMFSSGAKSLIVKFTNLCSITTNRLKWCDCSVEPMLLLLPIPHSSLRQGSFHVGEGGERTGYRKAERS